MTELEEEDDWEYDAYRMGRATRTVEVKGDDEPQTIEEGTIMFDPINREDTWMWEEDSWIQHYVGPDGGIGFGIGDDDNPGGVALRYDLVGIVEFPEPMTEMEAGEWLNENSEEWRQHLNNEIESNVTANDLLGGEIR